MVTACDDVNTGRYITFNESSPDLEKSSVSSSSIPAAFPNQQWPDYDGGVICMDGGTVWNINVASAV